MIPFNEPCGLWKTVHRYESALAPQEITSVVIRAEPSLTLDPCRHNLERVDQLRVEPGCYLDSDSGRDKKEVERTQVGLSDPRNGVLLD
jgi:hypothetical protein